jgi:hypothetical protein
MPWATEGLLMSLRVELVPEYLDLRLIADCHRRPEEVWLCLAPLLKLDARRRKCSSASDHALPCSTSTHYILHTQPTPHLLAPSASPQLD